MFNGIDMVIFTYKDYKSFKYFNKEIQKYKSQKKSKEYESMLCDINSEYQKDISKINNIHDKTFRLILSNKESAIKVINNAIKIKDKIKEDEIQIYNSSFITNQFENREADIVYKIKNENIFFLIEHQTKIDYLMPYRILNYKLEIIKSAINIKDMSKKNKKIPIVIPIVLYTGMKRWNANVFLEQIENNRFKNINLMKYNLVDINDYNEEELLKSKFFIDKIFLLEKVNESNNLIEVMQKIIQHVKEKDKETLYYIINNTLKEKIGIEKTNEFLNKLKENGGENMLAVIETIREENKMLINKGIKEGIRETAKAMLKENITLDVIMKVTKMKEEEIKKLQKEDFK